MNNARNAIGSVPGSRRPRACARARGFTVVEAAIAVAVALVLLAVAMPMLGGGMHRSGVVVSANNLRTLSQGYAAYEASWNGRQHSLIRPEMGNYGSCSTYTTSNCPTSLVLGADEGGSLWGYWLGSGVLGCGQQNGTCSNWSMIMPIAIGGTSGFPGINTLQGSCLLPNARGVREYVTGRFFDPVYWSPNDIGAYGQVSASLLDSPVEFPGYQVGSGDGFLPTYAYSGAALWHPEVFRRPSLGGYRAPGPTFAQAFATPTASACAYPALKTRMIERRWCQNMTYLKNPVYATDDSNMYFNQGPMSQPGALFFDGHVSFTAMSRYASDDASVRAQTGTDGLWSRDTPFGAQGVYSGGSLWLGDRASPNFLTTDGILGRDLLTAE